MKVYTVECEIQIEAEDEEDAAQTVLYYAGTIRGVLDAAVTCTPYTVED